MKKSSKLSESGYTLLEVLISLFILLTIVIPLITVIYRNSKAIDTEKSITAICLLEQESALVKAYPEETVPIRRRVINGREWTIKTEITGTGLLQYQMTVNDQLKQRGELVFYGRCPDEKK